MRVAVIGAPLGDEAIVLLSVIASWVLGIIIDINFSADVIITKLLRLLQKIE